MRKGANLHHKNLSSRAYTDLSNEEHFIFVNKTTHFWIHEIYRIYRKDKDVIKRLEKVLEEMYIINEEE